MKCRHSYFPLIPCGICLCRLQTLFISDYSYPKTLNGKSFKVGADGTHVGFTVENKEGDSLYYYIVIPRS
jgi:hypothetical protein